MKRIRATIDRINGCTFLRNTPGVSPTGTRRSGEAPVAPRCGRAL